MERGDVVVIGELLSLQKSHIVVMINHDGLMEDPDLRGLITTT